MNTRRARAAAVICLLVALTFLAACGDDTTSTTHQTVPPVDSLTPQELAQLYDDACASCHGLLGEGGVSGVQLKDLTAAEQQMIIDVIKNGAGEMPASGGTMTDEQIQALADYVAGLQ
jgi:mono/diheme cytochrome c family protein